MMRPYLAGIMACELGVGDVLGGGHGTGACVVDQDVDAAEVLEHLCHGGVYVLGVGDVAADGQRLDAELLGDLGRDLVDLLLAAGHHDDVGTLAGERLGHLHAQSTRSARNNGDLSLKIKVVAIHMIILPRRAATLCGSSYIKRYSSPRHRAILQIETFLGP